MALHDFSMLAASPDACHASKTKGKTKAQTLTNKPSKIIDMASFWSLFQLRPPGALPRSLPGPPGDLLAGPRPKEAPRAAQEPPSPPQEPPRSGLEKLPEGHLGLLGARFSTLRGPNFEASAASSAAFREALSLASRPLESTAPEAKKARKCKNQEPANRSESRHVKKMRKRRPRQQRRSKQPLAPKRQANKGGRRCRACGAFRRPPLAV